jgi:Tol biopolymer transport system component
MPRSRYMLLGVGLLLLALLPVVVPTARTHAQPTTTITLSTVDVGVAEAAFVEGRIACSAPDGCSAFTVQMTFDRDMIRVHSAQFGPYLGENVFGATNIIDNGGGTITLSGAAVQPPPPGAENVLFRLEVGGLVSGTAAIDIVNATVGDMTGAEIPTSVGGTVITVFDTGLIPFFSPPDAWEVAFVSDRDGNPEIYVVRADGTAPRRLTTNEVLDGGPTWSPDGERIAFHSQIDGGLDIYVMNGGGGGITRLTDHPASDFQPAWSPDGSQIAFVSEREGSADIFVMDADGSNMQRLTRDPAQDQQPAWSPDGSRIAFVSERSGTAEVFLINADGSGTPERITNLFGANGWYPAWKPDGTALSFTSERDALADLYMMPPTGENEKRLTPESDMLTSSDWSPDGAFLAYVSEQIGVPDLYVLDLEREVVFRLTADAAADSEPDWRPSGDPTVPCLVRAAHTAVSTRVGPGENRGEFTRLAVDQDFLVIGQALDAQGNLWYELDKTQIPGHEAVIALWVRARDVDSVGACDTLPQGNIPPIIPFNPAPPTAVPTSAPSTGGDPVGDDADDGGGGGGGGGGDDGPNPTDTPTPTLPPQPTCFTINTVILPDTSYGSVSLSPGQNCPSGSGWLAGTQITATANPAAAKRFTNWNGSTCPGVSGNTNPISFTLNGSCSLIATFHDVIID